MASSAAESTYLPVNMPVWSACRARFAKNSRPKGLYPTFYCVLFLGRADGYADVSGVVREMIRNDRASGKSPPNNTFELVDGLLQCRLWIVCDPPVHFSDMWSRSVRCKKLPPVSPYTIGHEFRLPANGSASARDSDPSTRKLSLNGRDDLIDSSRSSDWSASAHNASFACRDHMSLDELVSIIHD
jgi:hypothetical protein